jgi:hypothetical protein
MPGRCDHCGIDRGRVKVYLVREAATDQVLQVGTTCARDYLGLSVTPIFSVIVAHDDDGEECSGYGRGGSSVPTVFAVAAALAVVRIHGFTPASVCDRLPTRDILKATLWPTGNHDVGIPAVDIDAHVAEAQRVIAHFADAEACGDFEYNLRAIAGSEWVTDGQAGLVAAMPTAYDRAVGRIQVREARDAERARSQYIGTPGERLTVTGVVRQVVVLDAYAYGAPEPYLVVLATEEGNLVTWKTTAAIRTEIEVGRTVTLEGPVKTHEDRGYGKQTVIGGRGRVKATIEG